MINTGHNVTLAPIIQKQLGQMLVWRNNRKIWKWCRQNSVISEAQHMAWFNSLATRTDVKMFSILDNAGQFVGVCGLTDINRTNSRAEFSLYIGPEHQRGGLGKKALMTLIDHAFYDLNLHVIWGETFEGNPAAKMFESIGFRKEGTRRNFYYREGQYIDCHLYSIIKGEDTWDGHHLD